MCVQSSSMCLTGLLGVDGWLDGSFGGRIFKLSCKNSDVVHSRDFWVSGIVKVSDWEKRALWLVI